MKATAGMTGLDVPPTDATVPAGVGNFTATGLTTQNPLPNVVKKTVVSFGWKWRGVNATTDKSAGTSGAHTLYGTYAAPSQGANNKLTKKRIERLTNAASDDDEVDEVALDLWRDLDPAMPFRIDTGEDPWWSPPIWIGLSGACGNTDHSYQLVWHPGSCAAHANLLVHGLALEGISSSIDYIKPSRDADCSNYEHHPDNADYELVVSQP